MARPIPRALLIHSATHKYGEPVDNGWGNKTYPNSRELSFVRFEPSARLVLDRNVARISDEVRLSMVMFYDEQSSHPKDVKFEVGDEITFDGKPYRVASVDLLHDRGRLHHQEIGLV